MKQTTERVRLGRDLAGLPLSVKARSWHRNSEVVIGSEPCRVLDGDPSTWWASPYPAHGPKDVGVEFGKPVRIRAVEVGFLPFQGAYVPERSQQKVQAWLRGQWQTVSAKARRMKGANPVTWRHRFEETRTRRIRVLIEGDRKGTIHVGRLDVVSEDLDRLPQGLLWRGGAGMPSRHVASPLNDGDAVSCLPLEPLDSVGMEWPEPVRINGVLLRYVQFGFVKDEQLPAFSEQELEYWTEKGWKRIQAVTALNDSNRHGLAPYVRCGDVTCAFAFDAVRTSRIRVRFTGLRKRSACSGFRVYHSSGMRVLVSSWFARSSRAETSGGVRGRDVDLLADFPFMLESGGRGDGTVDLARMPRVEPGIAGMLVWSDRELGSPGMGGRAQASLCKLIDGRSDTAWLGPVSRKLPVAVGVWWLNPVMLGKLVMSYQVKRGKYLQPAAGQHELQFWDGRRWVSVDDEVLVAEDAGGTCVTWQHTFFPVCTTAVRLVVKKLDAGCAARDRLSVCRMGVFEEIPRAHKEWFAGPRSDAFGNWVLAQGEPSFERVSSHTPSMMGRACLGLKDEITETGVTWDGSLLTPWVLGDRRLPANWFLGFAFGANPRLRAAHRSAVRRRLLDDHLPGVEFTHYVDGLVYKQVMFATTTGEGKGITLVRISVRNPGREPKATRVAAVMLWNLKRVLPQIIAVDCRRVGGTRPALVHQGVPVLVYDKGGRFKDGLEKTVTYKLHLAPGEVRHLEFRLPRGRFGKADLDQLAGVRFDRALAGVRRRYRAFYESGMQVTVPEARVNRAWRYFLAQIALADYEGKMTYGPYPSRYDNSIWGIEEGPPMLGYAEFGHGQTAMEWFSATYLNEYHLDKANYHHQYRSGLTPMYARSVFNKTHDTAWLERAIPFLRGCADWIVAACRETSGSKGLHAGLLPRHFWGGDIHEPAFSLYANVVCCRGLKDVGILCRELGQDGAGSRYLEQAAAYRERLLAVVRKVAFPYASAPGVPLKLYWRRPYPYTCTHYQLLMPSMLQAGVLPLQESRECLRYMEQNGKFFCGVPMLYSGMALEPGARAPDYLLAVDPVYMLGYGLAYLRLDEVDRFLLCFYGLLAHGMDRDVLGGPEVGDVCLTESDRDWLVKAERRSIHGWHEPSDPLATESGIGLVLLKRMLVWEETDEEGTENGVLWLCRAAPRAWFEEGQTVVVERAPTVYGELSFQVQSHVKDRRIDVEADLSGVRAAKWVKVRLRHPDKARIRRVTENGASGHAFDPQSETVDLPVRQGRVRLAVHY